MCKHKNGYFTEVMEATHSRNVKNGILEKTDINEIDNIMYYEFICYDCKKRFVFKNKFPKWFEKYL